MTGVCVTWMVYVGGGVGGGSASPVSGVCCLTVSGRSSEDYGGLRRASLVMWSARALFWPPLPHGIRKQNASNEGQVTRTHATPKHTLTHIAWSILRLSSPPSPLLSQHFLFFLGWDFPLFKAPFILFSFFITNSSSLVHSLPSTLLNRDLLPYRSLLGPSRLHIFYRGPPLWRLHVFRPPGIHRRPPQQEGSIEGGRRRRQNKPWSLEEAEGWNIKPCSPKTYLCRQGEHPPPNGECELWFLKFMFGCLLPSTTPLPSTSSSEQR